MKYIPTIGLEIHAELKTKSKMFCDSPNDPLEQHPNVNVCPVCMGHPGTLPVANKEAIKLVQRVGLALNCEIAEYSKFDRKNYFYPDLPKGYQISQYDMPLCKGGKLKVGDRDIHITRIHLEEDTGRLQHLFEPEGSSEPERPAGADYSLVDFNRAGVPLMELVTEPDITSAKEASGFAQELQLILRYLGASDADMEKGQMRVEVNISLLPENPKHEIRNPKQLGTKVEIKNLNSFAAVEKAIEYEIKRQGEVLDRGEKVVQETRGWDDAKGTTYSQREKESAHDYRYFPEPDLPPFLFSKETIEALRSQLPELPQQRRKRFLEEYNLSEKETEVFIQNKDLGEYFEKVVSELGPKLSQERLKKLTKLSANYILSDLLGLLERASVVGEDFLITPENFAELILLIEKGEISSPIAKQVLKEMFANGKDPSQIIEDKGLAQIVDTASIESIAKDIIAKNPRAVEDFKKGKQNALQFLVGQMMAASKGTVNPETARKILQDTLKS